MANSVDIFVCNRGSSGPREYCACGMQPTKRCAFKLRGSKGGQLCGAPLCQRCGLAAGAQQRGEYCGPHARLLGREGGR